MKNKELKKAMEKISEEKAIHKWYFLVQDVLEELVKRSVKNGTKANN